MPLTQEEAKTLGQTLSRAFDGALGKALQAISQPDGSKSFDRPYQKMNDAQKQEIDRIGAAAATGDPAPSTAAVDFEVLYQKIKRRLIDECRVDPVLLHLMTVAPPELIVSIEPRTIELEGNTLKGRLAQLAARGFFGDQKTQADASRELKRTGAEVHSARLSEAFAAFVIDGFLTREDGGYRLAPGAKVTEKRLQA